MSGLIKGDATRRVIVLIVALIVIAAIILQFSMGNNNERENILDTLSLFGYNVSDDQLYIAGDYKNTRIAELLPEQELQSAVEASLKSGFPSDVQSRGDITLVLAACRDGSVITLYFLNGEMNLCFVQKPNSSEAEPLGGNTDD